MSFVVLTAPEEPAVSLEDMKRHLRVDDSDDDDFIISLTTGAQAGFENPDVGFLRRPVAYQQVEMVPCGSYPAMLFGPIDTDEPIQIVCRNSAGADVAIATSAYRIDRADTFSPRLIGLAGWPFGRDVRVRCYVGLDNEDPRIGNFQSAIKLAVQKIYDGVDNTDAIDKSINSLLSPYRVLSV